MLSATQAKTISDAITGGGTPDPMLLTESNTGNRMLDDANHDVLWAAKKGETTCVVNINIFPENVINSNLTTIQGLGYIVDEDRRRQYKEVRLSWD